MIINKIQKFGKVRSRTLLLFSILLLFGIHLKFKDFLNWIVITEPIAGAYPCPDVVVGETPVTNTCFLKNIISKDNGITSTFTLWTYNNFYLF